MLVRRCTVLWFEADNHPRFDLQALSKGGDGLDRSTRWLAYTCDADRPVELPAECLPLIDALDADTSYERAALAARFGENPVDVLLNVGIILEQPGPADEPIGSRRDTPIAWWPPALIAHRYGRWSGVDIERSDAVGDVIKVAEIADAYGPPPGERHRRRPELVPIALQATAQTAFDELLRARRTCRGFSDNEAVASSALACMLQRVFGARATHLLSPGSVVLKKSSPSGGALHSIEAYLLVQRAEGVATGLHHYLPVEHALEPLRELETSDAAALAHSVVAGQWWFVDAAVLVILTARFDRLFWKYRRHPKAWRIAQLDAGHLSQTLYLSAADLGLGAFVTCAVNDVEIERALDLDASVEGVVAVCGFGPRAARPMAIEIDDLPPAV